VAVEQKLLYSDEIDLRRQAVSSVCVIWWTDSVALICHNIIV